MASVINKINTGSTEYAIASTAYATCSTAASTPGKVAYILGTTATTGFTLTTGVTVYVKFTNTDTNNDSTKPTTLSINGCTAKPIKRNGITIAPGELQANCVYAFLYDGTNWQLVNGGPAVVIYTWD
jgi:hypothetical protein